MRPSWTATAPFSITPPLPSTTLAFVIRRSWAAIADTRPTPQRKAKHALLRCLILSSPLEKRCSFVALSIPAAEDSTVGQGDRSPFDLVPAIQRWMTDDGNELTFLEDFVGPVLSPQNGSGFSFGHPGYRVPGRGRNVKVNPRVRIYEQKFSHHALDGHLLIHRVVRPTTVVRHCRNRPENSKYCQNTKSMIHVCSRKATVVRRPRRSRRSQRPGCSPVAASV